MLLLAEKDLEREKMEEEEMVSNLLVDPLG